MTLLKSRKTFKPFDYPWAFEAYRKSEQMHWIVEEVPLHEDVQDWKNKLTDTERDFLTKLFRFFTQADIDVSGAYVNNYLPNFEQPEVRMMLLSFAAREATHTHAYSHLIETLGMKDTIYEEFLQYKAMADKHDYLSEFSGKDTSTIAQQIAVFSGFTEGMQLFSSFVMLMNFARFGKMKNMNQIIAWSINDEELHTASMIKLFREFAEQNPQIITPKFKKEIYTIADKMVQLEDDFIDLCFGVNQMEGLTKEDVKQYIRYIADRRLLQLGFKTHFKVKKNPLPWVEQMLSSSEHDSFFESKVSAYSKGSITGTWDDVWGKG